MRKRLPLLCVVFLSVFVALIGAWISSSSFRHWFSVRWSYGSSRIGHTLDVPADVPARFLALSIEQELHTRFPFVRSQGIRLTLTEQWSLDGGRRVDLTMSGFTSGTAAHHVNGDLLAATRVAAQRCIKEIAEAREAKAPAAHVAGSR
jgi:hypothetical protein